MNVALCRYAMLRQCRALSISCLGMKGHSKWDNIKDTKFAAMINKTKMAEHLKAKMKKIIRAGGSDPKFNKDLVQLQLEYRACNFSDDAFQKALKNLQQQPLKKAKFNIRGPSGLIIVIESEGLSQKRLQEFLVASLGKIGDGFQVTKNDYSKAFEDRGVVIVGAIKGDKTLLVDEVEEVCIELDCDEVNKFEEDGEVFYELICARNKFTHVVDILQKKGFHVKFSALELRALDPVEVAREDSEKICQLYKILQENENISHVYANVRLDSIPVRPVKMKIRS